MDSYNFLTLFQTWKAAKTRFSPFYETRAVSWGVADSAVIFGHILGAVAAPGSKKRSVLEKANPKQGLAFIGPLQSALNALLRVLWWFHTISWHFFKNRELQKHVFFDFMKHKPYLEEWLIMCSFLDTHWDQLQPLEAQNTVSYTMRIRSKGWPLAALPWCLECAIAGVVMVSCFFTHFFDHKKLCQNKFVIFLVTAWWWIMGCFVIILGTHGQ